MEIRVKKCAVRFKPPSTILMFDIDPKYADDFAKLEGKDLKDYTLTLIKKKEKSQTANNYMWQLCDKIAKKIGVNKEDIYRKSVREVGAFIDMTVTENNVESAIKCWENNGIGWFAEPLSKAGNYIEIRFYQGSSLYDGEQMRRLIDSVVDEAKEQKIDTISTTEIERLKQLWQEKTGT